MIPRSIIKAYPMRGFSEFPIGLGIKNLVLETSMEESRAIDPVSHHEGKLYKGRSGIASTKD